MKKLRLYYDQPGKIIYNIGLEGPGRYPWTVKKELSGLPANTQVLVLTDKQQIDDYLKHDNNHIQDGRLLLGEEAEMPSPPPIRRDLPAEIDGLDLRLKKLEEATNGG